MWHRRGNDRLSAWREFRHELTPLSLKQQLDETVKLWKNCHIGNLHYDSLDLNNCLAPWEHILEDSFNDFGRALGIAYTLILIDGWENDLKIQIFKDIDQSCFYNVVNVNDQYALNYQFDRVMNISDIPESGKLICTHEFIDLLNKTM